MKILVDENMPFARELFSRTGEVTAVNGRAITKAELKDADALMVRSVTKVDADLLDGTSVKFVGTATAGTDHIDDAFLATQGIRFAAAPGCNAVAVVEYVLSALLFLAERDAFRLADRTVGIVGVGNVGSRLQSRLEALGIATLLCDPPRADRGESGVFCALDKLVAEADILTFHTPLINEGRYCTRHLADVRLLQSLKPGTIVINACRGEVTDNTALMTVLNQRDDLSVVLDVWEAEPDIPRALLAKVDIGTAHIAGYTLEGKARGTLQVFESWCAFLGVRQQVRVSELLPLPDFTGIQLQGATDQATLKRLVHLVYDVRHDDAALRLAAVVARQFDYLRKHYPARREWASLQVHCQQAEAVDLLNKLGFNAQYVSPMRQN